MKLITVYTPTYNRANLLPRVYYSLCNQTNKGFIWMIVDDGSTDDTNILVKEWIEENKIEIDYHIKKNGGVHTARDYAYRHCNTELIVSCDSDDWLLDTAVESWINCWKNRNTKEDIGIFSVVVDNEGNRISSIFPDIRAASYQDFTYGYKCTKEKQTLIRTDIIRSIPESPVFPEEKIVGEGYKWIQLPNDKKFILMDIATRVYEQQTDGYIQSVASSRMNNPNGFRASYKQHCIYSKYLKPRIKGHIGYIAYSLILKDKMFLKESPNPFLSVVFFPLGWLLYKKISTEYRKTQKEIDRLT